MLGGIGGQVNGAAPLVRLFLPGLKSSRLERNA
jgi:hypothetical protein